MSRAVQVPDAKATDRRRTNPFAVEVEAARTPVRFNSSSVYAVSLFSPWVPPRPGPVLPADPVHPVRPVPATLIATHC